MPTILIAGRLVGCIKDNTIAATRCLCQCHRLPGQSVHFDPRSEKFNGDAEADARLTKEYREPWSVPGTV